MYALYTGLALIGLLALGLPVALWRRLTRGVAIITGTPHAASARNVLGQSSVSMQIRNAGSIAAAKRLTAQGRSSGKKR